MVVDGNVGYLKGHMEHNDRRGLADYIAKHNRYSTLEAGEMFKIQQNIARGTIIGEREVSWGTGQAAGSDWIAAAS